VVKDCAAILTLVEKLSDGEATAKEKLEVETHLEKCPGCRGQAEFLASLAKEARSMSFPEPPPSYWEHLPRKVLDRIDAEGRRPFRSALVAPARLRWFALGAAFLVAVAVSVSVLREGSRAPAAPPVAAEALNAPAPAAEEPEAPPPMARDEAAPAPVQSAPPGAAPGEMAATFERDASVADSSERRAPSEPSEPSENIQSLARARRPQAAAVSPAVSNVREPSDCDALRISIDSLVEGPPRGDARYQIALCSFGEHEREASDERRKRAIEDADLFLAIETEGPRAEEVREKLRAIQRD
jgi:hypothetical protein